ncbi:MAG: hypothetical protein A3H42_04525 [Deltaproteobacteria bacterium RIFCSPLOWO2_02_FULL_46_8]|nr:MAG: hypothetical protein A3H42_04525 [Deltaproteobacteria bacterium RIFCSPLOWO2_02_FULL_46_8]
MDHLIFTVLTIFVLTSLIALIDVRLRSFWGAEQSALKALLLLFSILSTLYQIAFILHFPLLFSLIDAATVLLCLFFFRPILAQLKEYVHQIFVRPWKEGEKILYVLYLFLGYLFILSIFAVQGLNWDSMIYHLSRSFLYLNEGTIFTPHYSDYRQTVWPMGIDVLTYIFTRQGGSTLGVGFIQYVFYIGTLLAVYQTALRNTNRKTAVTTTFVAASLPVIVYGATTVKTDLPVVFAFLMMWICFNSFQKTRSKSDLFIILLALVFGLGCKTSFLFLGPLSLLAFVGIELFHKSLFKPLTGSKLSWGLLFFLTLWFLFLAQVHLAIYNLMTYGNLMSDNFFIAGEIRTWESLKWTEFIQDFVKHQLTLFDFLLPLSTVNIPFVDTFISFSYNHTIGWITGDTKWVFRYFPHEVWAAFGPFFGVFILWKTYRTGFSKGEAIPLALAWISILWILVVAYKIPIATGPCLRYFEPTFIASLVFLPKIFQSRVLQWHRSIRLCSVALLTFCCLCNYDSPLIVTHPRVVPWYTYAFTDRGFFYTHKYYLDNRLDIYQKLIKEKERASVFVFANIRDWVFPYYQYAPKAKIRLANFDYKKERWTQEDFHRYDLIICNWQRCIKEWDQKKDFEKIWEYSAPTFEPGPWFFPKQAAFYRPKK